MAKSKEGISLSLKKYVFDILEEIGLLGSKPVDTSMYPNVKLCVDQVRPLSSLDQCRRLVGKLNYLKIGRAHV